MAAVEEVSTTPVVDSLMAEAEGVTRASKVVEEAAGNRTFPPDLCLP